MLPALLLVAVVTAGQSPGAPVQHYWRWTDGSLAAHRTLSVPASTLPSILVTSTPAEPGRRVTLEVRIAGRWSLEDAAVEDGTGRAVLDVNPFCSSGDWCTQSFDYRVTVGSDVAPLRVSFRR
jgi:hypothetical protein